MGGEGKLEVFTGLSVGVACPCMTRCLFVIYLYATSQLKKRKGKKLELVLEIDVDKMWM